MYATYKEHTRLCYSYKEFTIGSVSSCSTFIFGSLSNMSEEEEELLDLPTGQQENIRVTKSWQNEYIIRKPNSKISMPGQLPDSIIFLRSAISINPTIPTKNMDFRVEENDIPVVGQPCTVGHTT